MVLLGAVTRNTGWVIRPTRCPLAPRGVPPLVARGRRLRRRSVPTRCPLAAQVAPDLARSPWTASSTAPPPPAYATSAAAAGRRAADRHQRRGRARRLHDEDTRLTATLADADRGEEAGDGRPGVWRVASLRAIAVASYTGDSTTEPDRVGGPRHVRLACTGATRPLETASVSTSQFERSDRRTRHLVRLSHGMNDASRRNASAVRQRSCRYSSCRTKPRPTWRASTPPRRPPQVDLDQARVTANVVGDRLPTRRPRRLPPRRARRPRWSTPPAASRGGRSPGITRVESRHGTFGGSTLLVTGGTSQRIVGIPLDGDEQHRAHPRHRRRRARRRPGLRPRRRPMQFIPSTWRRYAADGNGDGDADPNNIYDAAPPRPVTCARPARCRRTTSMTRGFFSYNHSDAYAALGARVREELRRDCRLTFRSRPAGEPLVDRHHPGAARLRPRPQHAARRRAARADRARRRSSGRSRGMQIAPEQGAFLTILTPAARRRHAVEVGTFTGYSSLCIARGLADGGRLALLRRERGVDRRSAAPLGAGGVADRIDLRIAPGDRDAARAARPSRPSTSRSSTPTSPATSATTRSSSRGCDRTACSSSTTCCGAARSSTPDATDDEHRRHPSASTTTSPPTTRVDVVMLPIGDGLTVARKR